MTISRFLCQFMLIFAFSSSAFAHEECAQEKRDCSSCHMLTVPEAAKLLRDVGDVKEVKQSPVRGLFEITVENKGQRGIAYVDFGKKHIIAGPIFDIATKKAVGETLPPPRESKVAVGDIPLANSIILGNAESKKKLFVFTDPECPYCAKLHQELVKLMYMDPDLGIYVKLFPLEMHPQAYDKSRVILAGKNPLFLLDKAFAGEQLPPAGQNDPRKPVDDNLQLAKSLGITATPTLILPDGEVVMGYRSAGDIKKLINGASIPK